ncbi:hypothetical protein L1887_50720 [Cichorium endivia]|nr:hypothetical protein L1887_50720 [Cichorium endivia]
MEGRCWPCVGLGWESVKFGKKALTDLERRRLGLIGHPARSFSSGSGRSRRHGLSSQRHFFVTLNLHVADWHSSRDKSGGDSGTRPWTYAIQRACWPAGLAGQAGRGRWQWQDALELVGQAHAASVSRRGHRCTTCGASKALGLVAPFPTLSPPSSCHASRLDSASSSERDSCIPPRPAHSIGEATPPRSTLHPARALSNASPAAHSRIPCLPSYSHYHGLVWASPRFLLQQFPSHFHLTTLSP